MLHGQVNVPVEFPLTGGEAYADPFNEVEVDVAFTDPNGGEWRQPAYWAGGNVFRVRFAAPAAGRYTWRSECSNEADTGLHGQRGDMAIGPGEGAPALCRRGRLRVAATGRTLQHADGTPFLWLADTWWFGLIKRLDWPHGFQRLAADRVAKGFSAVQIVAGPLPDFDADVNPWDPQQENEAGLSWAPGWERINPSFYDMADLRIAWLVDKGLVPCIVGMWGYFLPAMGIERVRRHWRNLVARYGAYPVVWCVSGEADMPTYSHTDSEVRAAEKALQAEGWTEVARYVREIDPYHNLVTAHPSHPDSRAVLTDETVLDLDMLQTTHQGYGGLEHSIEVLSECVAKEPRMPTFVAEACYEGIMGGSREEVQRFLFWTSVLSGACGFTYGAHGIWAMSSRDDPHVGFTGSWGDGCWQDAMHYPGSTHVGLGRKILERYPWWRFEQRREPAIETTDHVAPYAAGIPGVLALFYFPVNCMDEKLMGMQGGGWRAMLPLAIEPGAEYEAAYVDPRTGREVSIGRVAPDAEGCWTPPGKPSMEDWLLVLVDREKLTQCS